MTDGSDEMKGILFFMASILLFQVLKMQLLSLFKNLWPQFSDPCNKVLMSDTMDFEHHMLHLTSERSFVIAICCCLCKSWSKLFVWDCLTAYLEFTALLDQCRKYNCIQTGNF